MSLAEHAPADRLPAARVNAEPGLPVAALWVVFLFGASAAARSLAPGVENIERYFWLPADLAVLGWALLRPAQLLDAFSRNRIIVLWAGIACLSTLWSLAPGVSLYHGAQLLLTILVAFLLCTSFSGLRVLQILFFALLMTQLLSLAMVLLKPSWGIAPWGEWRGAFTHKNELGAMTALQIITALLLYLHGWRRTLTGAAILLAAGLLIMSQSGTALLALLLALALLPLASAFRAGQSLFAGMAGMAMLLIAGIAGLIMLSSFNPADATLDALGKDMTLTGRTVLWDFGAEAFANRPWLGHGYKGYWESPLTSASNLQYVMGQELWFFHNTFVEVAVGFGVVGLVLLVAGLITAWRHGFAAFAAARSYPSLWPLSFLFFLIPYLIAENPLFQNHGLFQLLFVVALCTSFGSGVEADDAENRPTER